MTAMREEVRRTDPETDYRHYSYPPTGEQLVSVTTVLGDTEGKPWLAKWNAALAAEYAVDNIDVLVKMLAGEGSVAERRQAAITLTKEEAARIRDLKADAGTYVHDLVEALILWGASPDGTGTDIALPMLPEHLVGATYDDEPIEEVTDWMIQGFLNFCNDFAPVFTAAEMPVYNQPLGVAGTLDIIADLPNLNIGRAGTFISAPGHMLPLCIDVKTGKNRGVTWREQVAAYRRMRQCLLPMGELAPLPRTAAAAVLHLRPEHEDCYQLMLVSAEDDEKAWQTFLKALGMWKDRQVAKAKPGKVVYPPRPDGSVPSPRLRDLDGEGYGRALSPLVKAGIPDLEALAAMTAGQCLAVKGIGGKTVDVVRKMLADHGLHLSGEEVA